ncbi:MAG: glycoside hydrolase family 19 protein [Betaproteobacteria bacterium]|nr:glycoside hydrolase family 19 protein [Betaproteobacteria bacterium]
MITPELLVAAGTGVTAVDARISAEFLGEAAVIAAINTPRRVACFLGQLGHECPRFRSTHEDLHYSADRLRNVWPRHFPDQYIAEAYAFSPVKIGNRAYANRMGNGDEASGDGYRFRGRGYLQLTGRENYAAASAALFGDARLLDAPDLAIEPETAARVAAWFWTRSNCNALADALALSAITRAINGGMNGYDDRAERTARVLKLLDPHAAACGVFFTS